MKKAPAVSDCGARCRYRQMHGPLDRAASGAVGRRIRTSLKDGTLGRAREARVAQW
jgi:hypothetical protein